MANELVIKKFDPNQLFYTMVKFFKDNKDKINPNTGYKQRVDICCEGSSRCFDGSQKILCSDGSKLISEIKKGDKVYSYDHKTGKDILKTVDDVIITKNTTKKCLKIKLKNGSEINCTEDHEIFYNGRYVLAKELVYLCNNLKHKDNEKKEIALQLGITEKHLQRLVNQIKLEDILSIEETTIETLYDLTIQDNHNYYLDCVYPVLVHNSGKTFDIFDFIIFLCDQFRKRPLSIYVVRKTLKSCREIAYKEDFTKKLQLAGIYNSNYARNENQSPEYTLWGSTIKFMGLDGGEELGRSDVIYVNEALDINDEKVMNNLLMRCEMLGLFDWNPKYSKHFIFKWENRFNTLFTKTTFRDNKHLDQAVRGNILSKCPWDFDDYDEEKREWKVPVEKRRPNVYNITQGTANLHDWMVYGEGVRCPEEGAVFKNINWISEFPSDCDSVHFGLDFGYTTDPSVLTKVGRKGKNIYIQYLTYNPYENTGLLYQAVMPFLLTEQQRRKKEARGLETANIIIACDSADRYKDVHFVRELNSTLIYENKKIESDCLKAKIDPEKHKIHGIQFNKVKKPMITVRLNNMKKFILHVVETPEAVEEFDNYVYMIIEGNQTNIPIDKHNHGIDSAGYCIWQFHKWK